MQINIKEDNDCKLTIQYIADSEEILNKRTEVLKLFKKAPVPGYRKNKVSIDAIKIYYKTQIEESLKRALAEDAYHNSIFEKKLRPHAQPQINLLTLNNKEFVCEFNLFVKPNFELNKYRDFEIAKPHEPVSSTEFAERLLQELRVRNGSAIPYGEDDFVQVGDNVILDYDSFIDGEKVDHLSAKGEMISVGHSQIIEFDNNLLGMKINEVREFSVSVPENGLPSLAGKNINFKVTLTMGAKNEPCPLDDELAIKLGKKDFIELREFVSKTAMVRTTNAYKMALNNSVANHLINLHQFIVPNWLSLYEAKYLAQHSKMDWEKTPDLDKEKFIEIASKNVKLSLILDRIREVEPEAQLSDQEVFDMLKANIVQNQPNAKLEDVINEMKQKEYLPVLFSRIRDEFTLDFITKTSKIIE